MKKTVQQGFTLIELMIVVAIVAILAAIAIPAYQDYIVRSQVTEGLSLADGSKTAIAEFYSNTGRFPTSQASAGLSPAASITGSYVTSVTATSVPGQIQVDYGNKANTKIAGKDLYLSAITSGGSTSWTCKHDTVDQRYVPTTCRN